jgi:uncharacterized delta-60 repeat protein
VGPLGAAADRFVLDIGTRAWNFASLALQTDGKIVVAGVCTQSTSATLALCVARLNANGSRDSSFVGSAGTDVGISAFVIQNHVLLRAQVAVQNDGKIVLAGTCLDDALEQVFCVARLNADGSFDATFVGPEGTAEGRFSTKVGTGSTA